MGWPKPAGPVRHMERTVGVSEDKCPASYSFRHCLVWPGHPGLPECSQDQARVAHSWQKSAEPDERNWVCNDGGGEPVNHLCNPTYLWTSCSVKWKTARFFRLPAWMGLSLGASGDFQRTKSTNVFKGGHVLVLDFHEFAFLKQICWQPHLPSQLPTSHCTSTHFFPRTTRGM